MAKYRDGADVDTLPGGEDQVAGPTTNAVRQAPALERLTAKDQFGEAVDMSPPLNGQVATEFIDRCRAVIADERAPVAATVLKYLDYLV